MESSFKCDLSEDWSLKDVGDALDQVFDDPKSLTVRKKIMSEAASCLFYVPDNLQYMLDYASKRSIAVDLCVDIGIIDHPSVQTYLTYLRQHKLSVSQYIYNRIIDLLNRVHPMSLSGG